MDAFKRAAKDDLLAGLNGIKEKVGPKLPPTVAADDWQSVASITEEDLICAMINAWVPQGWQAKKDTLLDDREVNRS